MPTFFFVKDGRRMWAWIGGLFSPRHRAGAEEPPPSGAFTAVPLAAVTGAVIDFARS